MQGLHRMGEKESSHTFARAVTEAHEGEGGDSSQVYPGSTASIRYLGPLLFAGLGLW